MGFKMDKSKTIDEITEILGYPEGFKPERFDGGNSEEAIIYFYDLFCKSQEGSLSFVEVLDAYSQSLEGRGIVYLLSESEDNERIEEVLGLEKRIERPYLEWRTGLPKRFKEVLEKTIHQHYQKNPQDNFVRIIIEKARELFYDRLVYTRSTEEREVWPGKRVPAGHSFFGRHFSVFEQDAEKDLARFLYIMFRGEAYYYENPILGERGRLKILVELQQRDYLTAEQSRTIDQVKKELLP